MLDAQIFTVLFVINFTTELLCSNKYLTFGDKQAYKITVEEKSL